MQIIVTIKPDGHSKVEAKGATGSSCKQLTRDIEQALGKTTQDEKKPEYFQSSQTRQEIRR